MFISVNSLVNCTVLATDGEIGKVDNLYFDNKTWSTAYVVLRVSDAIGGKRVFLPPTALGKIDRKRKEFAVVYSKEQVMSIPDLNPGTQAKREGVQLNRHDARIPFFMPGPSVDLSIISFPASGARDGQSRQESLLEEDDPHLRSANDVTRYHIRATDEKVGHVDDLIVDDSTWAICHLVVATSRWLPSRKVLIGPQSVKMINRSEGMVYVDLTMRRLKASPRYVPPMPMGQERAYRFLEDYDTQYDYRMD
jgi:sporulation protein YlmC with PRC-barrel domain